jgi:acetyltransferase
LPDGGCIVTRRIRRDDKKHLQSGMENLSLQSRRYRFLAPISKLPDPLLKHLTEVDYFNHDAWVALLLDPDDPTEFEPAGVGRYVRSKDNRQHAEFALIVADAHQGRGIGTILLKKLASAAQQAEISILYGVVLGDNAPMLHLLRKLGGHKQSEDEGSVIIEIPVLSILEAESTQNQNAAAPPYVKNQ